MNIQRPGEYRTRNGATVLVWGFKPEFIAPDAYIVFGSMLMKDGSWNDLTWTIEGHFTQMPPVIGEVINDMVENDIVEYVCPIGEGLH